MAKAQFPIDGAQGKTWKVSSKMGWRIHPVKKTKKHHNGTDIFGVGKGPHYIESFYDGKVLKATVSTAAGGGFGHYVIVQHKIGKDYYTSLYAHLKPGSVKVKPGQKIEAGTVLGIMGTSGMSTGIHLHWEIWKGKQHGWSADGKGFVEPISFVDALIKMEEAQGFANVATPEGAPVEVIKVEDPKPAPKTVAARPASKPAAAKAKTHKVVSGDTLSRIAARNGTTVDALAKLNNIKNVNSIRVGQVLKLG